MSRQIILQMHWCTCPLLHRRGNLSRSLQKFSRKEKVLQNRMNEMLSLRNTTQKSQNGWKKPIFTMVMTVHGTRALRKIVANWTNNLGLLAEASASTDMDNASSEMTSAARTVLDAGRLAAQVKSARGFFPGVGGLLGFLWCEHFQEKERGFSVETSCREK